MHIKKVFYKIIALHQYNESIDISNNKSASKEKSIQINNYPINMTYIKGYHAANRKSLLSWGTRKKIIKIVKNLQKDYNKNRLDTIKYISKFYRFLEKEDLVNHNRCINEFAYQLHKTDNSDLFNAVIESIQIIQKEPEIILRDALIYNKDTKYMMDCLDLIFITGKKNQHKRYYVKDVLKSISPEFVDDCSRPKFSANDCKKENYYLGILEMIIANVNKKDNSKAISGKSFVKFLDSLQNNKDHHDLFKYLVLHLHMSNIKIDDNSPFRREYKCPFDQFDISAINWHGTEEKSIDYLIILDKVDDKYTFRTYNASYFYNYKSLLANKKLEHPTSKTVIPENYINVSFNMNSQAFEKDEHVLIKDNPEYKEGVVVEHLENAGAYKVEIKIKDNKKTSESVITTTVRGKQLGKMFQPGDRVIISGMERNIEFEDKPGTVIKYHSNSGRYQIKFKDTKETFCVAPKKLRYAG
ncbi:MAG: hypothetical protein GY730_11145 [bacterium]|nr:hypothetical protein [bacterium]